MRLDGRVGARSSLVVAQMIEVGGDPVGVVHPRYRPVIRAERRLVARHGQTRIGAVTRPAVGVVWNMFDGRQIEGGGAGLTPHQTLVTSRRLRGILDANVRHIQ
jgi:hypothetical protein